MKFHPYSEVFPLLEGAAFDELVADVKAFGLREKIWLYDGKVLDGRNRFRACQKAKIDPGYRTFRGTAAGALALVISENVNRRHLTDTERAFAAAELAKLQDGQRKSPSPAGEAGLTQAEAAKALKVSKRSVERARKVRDKGSKALQKAAKAGEIPLSRAAAVADLPKAEQLPAAKAQKPEPAKPIEVAPAPDFDFSTYEPEDDDAYKASIENVMMADDKLAAMREELKQARREMQGFKSSRDHYQSEAGAAVRLVKARDREIEKLNRDLAKARSENESLRERIAIMEQAA